MTEQEKREALLKTLSSDELKEAAKLSKEQLLAALERGAREYNAARKADRR